MRFSFLFSAIFQKITNKNQNEWKRLQIFPQKKPQNFMVNFHPQLNIDKYPFQIDAIPHPLVLHRFLPAFTLIIHEHCMANAICNSLSCDVNRRSIELWFMLKQLIFNATFFLLRSDMERKTLVLHAITGIIESWKRFVGSWIVLSSISI